MRLPLPGSWEAGKRSSEVAKLNHQNALRVRLLATYRPLALTSWPEVGLAIDQLQGYQSPKTLLSQEFAAVTDQLNGLQQLLQRALQLQLQLQLQSGKSGS